jgi:hypothetical protein
MHLLLLGGNHKSNKEWVEEVEKGIKHMFDSTFIQYYDHWEEKAGNIDFANELKKLIKNSENVKDLIIFAKSAGTLLTLRGVYEKKISPKKCIFVGTAIYWARSCGYDIDSWLRNFNVPTLFIQKTKDPAISYEDLLKLIQAVNVTNFRISKIVGEGHDYKDIREMTKLIREFISVK